MNSYRLYYRFKGSLEEGVATMPEADFRRRLRLVHYLRTRLFNR